MFVCVCVCVCVFAVSKVQKCQLELIEVSWDEKWFLPSGCFNDRHFGRCITLWAPLALGSSRQHLWVETCPLPWCRMSAQVPAQGQPRPPAPCTTPSIGCSGCPHLTHHRRRRTRTSRFWPKHLKKTTLPTLFYKQGSLRVSKPRVKMTLNFEEWESFLHFWESTTSVSINSLRMLLSRKTTQNTFIPVDDRFPFCRLLVLTADRSESTKK